MATEIAFKPFAALRSEGNHLEERFERVQLMIDQGQYTEAIHSLEDLMKLTLAGLRYLQTYSNSRSL
jgi:phosphatidylinositol glycan class N